MTQRIELIREEGRPDLSSRPVTSTHARCGTASIKLGVVHAHLEAGLRGFARAMPEEVNGVVATSQRFPVHPLYREARRSARFRSGSPLAEDFSSPVETSRSRAGGKRNLEHWLQAAGGWVTLA